MPVRPGFGVSNVYRSEIPNNTQTKYPYPVAIIKPASMTSETPTKDTSHVPNELQSGKSRNMLLEYPSGYRTGDPSTMASYKQISKPSAQLSSDPDVIKRGS